MHTRLDLIHTRLDLAEWLERLAVDAKVATALGSIPAPPPQWNLRGDRYRNLYNNITDGETDLVWGSRNNDDRLVAVIFDLKTKNQC
jgi:hypothetical protein